MSEQAVGAYAAVFLVLVLAGIVAFAPVRLRSRLVGWWIASPAILYWLVILYEMQSRQDDPASSWDNAWAGFYLLSAMAIVPWLLLCVLGYAIGRAWRTLFVRNIPQEALADHVLRASSEPAGTARIKTNDPETLRLGAIILDHADRFGVPRANLPTIGYSLEGAAPIVFADGDGYHIAYDERGVVFDDCVTRDTDEFLYWVFQSATEAMASDYVSSHPRKRTSYIELFREQQAKLLRMMNPAWEQRWLVDRTSLAWRYRQLSVVSSPASSGMDARGAAG